MSAKTLYDRVFDAHVVKEISAGQFQLFIDLHLVNEVSSPQAFETLEEGRLTVRYPQRTVATMDHAVATEGDPETAGSAINIRQVARLRENVLRHQIPFFDPRLGQHGILHVVVPERGMMRPGMTVACGDSHTSTHGAFGALAFGIGTSQVRDVLASQTLLMEKLKVRRILVGGVLPAGVYAKDLALHIIRRMGAKAGVGHVHEYGGTLIDALAMEERMTLCNMAVEGGARAGYVNPDAVTAAYLRDREHIAAELTFDEEQASWEHLRSGDDADYDDELSFDGSNVAPLVTWGTSPDQCVAVDETVPHPATLPEDDRERAARSQEFMGLAPGQAIEGLPIDVAFVGSCTNGRLSDIEAMCRLLSDSDHRVAPHVRALVVPGSRRVREAMHARGMDGFLLERGFQVRDAGCSLCCGMNADMLEGREVCASSSNRNFRGRQGSPLGRTLLMSPVMVAAAAVTGAVADSRRVFGKAPA